ncbi:MAG: type II toxin-antitoxin system RelE/ParE family toxin [Methylophilaceae bacterium]|jgi:toxin ParE2
MKVRFLLPAQYELDEAIEYYNSEVPELGNAFLLETLAVIERICQYPEGWHPLSPNTRRCRLRRFPYGVVYAMLDGEIVILAVAHLHRKPDYWRERLSQ